MASLNDDFVELALALKKAKSGSISDEKLEAIELIERMIKEQLRTAKTFLNDFNYYEKG